MPQIPGIRNNPVPEMVEPPVIQELVLYQCAVRTSDIPDGGKILRFICPNGWTVSVPLSAEGVETVIQRLKGTGLTVPKGVFIPQ